MRTPSTSDPSIFSAQEDLDRIRANLQTYLRLPLAEGSVPGAVMEHTLASVREAKVLKTYDFVDVLKETDALGWQVKSTKARTPVTWKRAKIENSSELIADSEKHEQAVQALGDEIIRTCNLHGRESLKRYRLKAIGYSRLIVRDGGSAMYFERELITDRDPDLFDPDEFSWRWSQPRKNHKKEQLPALHGTYLPSGERWFAWHGKGENQLHFKGEHSWWPDPTEPHAITFALPVANRKGRLGLSEKDARSLTSAFGTSHDLLSCRSLS